MTNAQNARPETAAPAPAAYVAPIDARLRDDFAALVLALPGMRPRLEVLARQIRHQERSRDLMYQRANAYRIEGGMKKLEREHAAWGAEHELKADAARHEIMGMIEALAALQGILPTDTLGSCYTFPVALAMRKVVDEIAPE